MNSSEYVWSNVQIKIWFLMTATRFEIKRRRGIEFVMTLLLIRSLTAI